MVLKANKIPELYYPLDCSLLLVGMMGCGKSTLGSRFAKACRMPFVDVDAEIEKAAFDETYYRNVMRFFYPDEQWVETPQETKRDILERMSYLTSLAEESDIDIANELIELQQRLATAPDDSAAIPFSFNDLPGKTFFEAYHYNENTATYAVLVAQMNGNTYQYRHDSDSYRVRESNAETLEQKKDFKSTKNK